jgi:opacity protein-like surface antigen
MYHSKRAFFFALLMVVLALVPGFSQNLPDLQKGVEDFSASLAKSLPLNSSLGLNWSDAYIGQLLGPPPHFGVGVSAGVSTLDFDAINDLMDILGSGLPFNLAKMILPGYTAEARVGGFILPFDAGIKVGILPGLKLSDISLDYTNVGGDIRYAVLEGNPLLPVVSLGLGLNYLRGGINTTVPTGMRFSFTEPGGSHTLAVSDADLGFSWETTALDLTAQVSKSLILVTPYLGLGVNYAWSKAGYTVKTDLTYDGKPLNSEEAAKLKEALSKAEIAGITVDETGFSSIIDKSGLGLRIFGGLSFNIAVIRIDLTALYGLLSGDFGGTLGLRFQL